MSGLASQQQCFPTRRGFQRGVIATLPMLFAVLPFGLIFGALAADVGLTPAQTMGMSLAVIAGAAQLAALQLMTEDAPALVAIMTGAIVNLRIAMYSASLATHIEAAPMRWRIPLAYLLFDQTYALSIKRFTEHPQDDLGDRLGFFFGIGLFTASIWVTTCLIGIYLGMLIPNSWGLEFLVPVVFLALAAPMIRGSAYVVAAIVAAAISLAASSLPYGLGLIFGTAAGIAAGMLMPNAEAKDG